MKKMKKLASLILAVVMVLSMTVAAFADNTVAGNGNFSITLDSKSDHIYRAYQIFTGDLLEENSTKTLSNVKWGNGIVEKITEGEQEKTLIGAIKAVLDDAGYGSDENPKKVLTDTATARDVAEELAKMGKDSSVLQEFAKALTPFLDATGAKESTETKKLTGEEPTGESTYEISNLTAGYYLVEDVASDTGVTEGDAYSRYIMEVVADVTADVKVTAPELTKKIVTDAADGRADSNTAGIGQVVTYELKGKVPDHQSYDKYFYVIHDTLSEGLTFNNDITVTIGDMTLTKIEKSESASATKDNYYVYTDKKDISDGCTFEIAFAKIKEWAKDSEIVVTYSATVNASAVTGADGNPNTVKLEYSNNPNFKYEGENEGKPGKPDPDKNIPTGKTPDDKVITYVAEIDITKYKDKVSEDNYLPGAEFTLTGTSNQVVLKSKECYVQDGNGEYYLLKDGTYTKEAPTLEDVKDDEGNVTTKNNVDLYVSTTVKYTLKTVEETTVVSTPVKMVVTSGNDGKVIFKSLGVGVYTIEETGVPAGYNKADDVVVEIGCKTPEDININDKATWNIGTTSTRDVDDNYIVSLANFTIGVYALNIINNAGSLLPSTGGIGTTIFYAAGIILMAGAVFFVVRRKRA